MRTAILAIVACASIATARAATEKAPSDASGQSPPLVSGTAVSPTDSPLVRAAKLTVASRLHVAATNVWEINDSTVKHSMRVLGESAPSAPSKDNGSSPRVVAAPPPTASTAGVDPSVAARKAQRLQMEQQRRAQGGNQPYSQNPAPLPPPTSQPQ